MISLLNVNAIKTNVYKPARTEPKNNRFISTKQVGDSFSFTGRNESFNRILNTFCDLKLSETELVLKCICEDFIGQGGHARVYKIPIKGFEDFVLKKERTAYNVGSLSQVVDDFPTQNFGQPVAELGKGFSILKKVPGKSLEKHQALGYNDVEEVTNNYYKILAGLPQDSYDGLISQIKVANGKGYKFDQGSSGNIMLNKNKLSIIDLNKSEKTNTLADPLLTIFYKLKLITPQISSYKNTILTKMLTAAQKEKFPVGSSSSSFDALLYCADDEFRLQLEKLK